MTRKDFLLTGTGGIAGLLMFLSQTRCKSPAGPTTPPTENSFTSTSVNGHTHSITIQNSEVQNPPAAGISRETSSTSGHTHTFTMTQADLQNVMGGGTATIVTAITSSHQHSFTITKWF